MNQSSNIYCANPYTPKRPCPPLPCPSPCHCPRPKEPKCCCECECNCCHHTPVDPCNCHDDENFFCRPNPPCRPCPPPCSCGCACECDCDCNCNDPENFFHRPGSVPAPCCAPSHCSDMARVLSCYIGKRVIICINGTRMRVIICEICGTFVKALAYGCGKTLYINLCKIDDVKVSC